MNAVYFLYAGIAKMIPITAMPIQKQTVALQPSQFETNAIPYIELAAPIYTKALVSPLTVEDLPNEANLPGTQEISRKFTPCIAAHIRTVRIRLTIRAATFVKPIVIASGIASTAEAPKRIAAPRISLLKSFPLCRVVVRDTLIIENIGSATATRIDSFGSLSNA